MKSSCCDANQRLCEAVSGHAVRLGILQVKGFLIYSLRDNPFVAEVKVAGAGGIETIKRLIPGVLAVYQQQQRP